MAQKQTGRLKTTAAHSGRSFQTASLFCENPIRNFHHGLACRKYLLSLIKDKA
ncbi:hypothetical protein HMPREF9120_02809 [Neisseria sp. oral taxon 020 str. F0370]|nr:hypothetical protein HMPREF9120_02809 [Neisseria sp. oral taxon 020 str. F0370]